MTQNHKLQVNDSKEGYKYIYVLFEIVHFILLLETDLPADNREHAASKIPGLAEYNLSLFILRTSFPQTTMAYIPINT